MTYRIYCNNWEEGFVNVVGCLGLEGRTDNLIFIPSGPYGTLGLPEGLSKPWPRPCFGHHILLKPQDGSFFHTTEDLTWTLGELQSQLGPCLAAWAFIFCLYLILVHLLYFYNMAANLKCKGGVDIQQILLLLITLCSYSAWLQKVWCMYCVFLWKLAFCC